MPILDQMGRRGKSKKYYARVMLKLYQKYEREGERCLRILVEGVKESNECVFGVFGGLIMCH